MNCVNSGRKCEGYGVRLVFDVDDSRNLSTTFNAKGEKKHGFRGRPKLNEALKIQNDGGNNYIHQPHSIGHVPPTVKIEPGLHDVFKSEVGKSSKNLKKRIDSMISETKQNFESDQKNINLTPGKFDALNAGHVDSLPNPASITARTPPSNLELLPPKSVSLSSRNSSINTPNTNTVSSLSDRDFDIEFSDEQQFEDAFLSGLDYILDNYDNELLNPIDLQFPILDSSNTPLNANNNNSNYNTLTSGPDNMPNQNGVPHVNSSGFANNTVDFSLDSNIHKITMDNLNNAKSVVHQNTHNQHTYNISETDLDTNKLGPQLKKKEESHILKHFFEKVIYLLDAHPQTPWPQLMMKFGSVDLAKSCFLSLSSMHLYVNNGGDEFYKKGLLHINNTMEYLIKYVKTSGISKQKEEKNLENEVNLADHTSCNEKNPSTGQEPTYVTHGEKTNVSNNPADPNENENISEGVNELGLNVPSIISKIKAESHKKKGTNFIVILLLLYVHLLFAILESGRSALARMFLKLSSSIASDPLFKKKMEKIKQSQSLLCVLSWFDTVSALVSPDCRIPYCDPKWFGESDDIISTDKMNGCPVGMFRVLYDLSLYRHETMLLFSQKGGLLSDIKLSHKKLLDLRDRCLHYRDHVLYVLPHGSTFSYIDRLKCSQLWSLAGVLLTIQLELHYFAKLPKWIEQNRNFISDSEFPDSVPSIHIYSERATAIVTEFLSVYNTIPSTSPIITQMVWPIFYVGICSYNKENRTQSWQALKTLYETVKMGTIKSNMEIVNRIWAEECSLESILAGEGWYKNGIDLLPC